MNLYGSDVEWSKTMLIIFIRSKGLNFLFGDLDSKKNSIQTFLQKVKIEIKYKAIKVS